MFVLVCRCAVLARSQQNDRGGKHRGVWWIVLRARVRGTVPQAGARERVPRAGARIRRRQVQSQPLMHI